MVQNKLSLTYEKDFIDFNEKGFLLIKNIIPKSLINDFEKSFFELFSSFLGEKLLSGWDDPEFELLIQKHRKKNPLLVRRLYVTSRQLKSYQNLFSVTKLLKILEIALKVSSNYFIFSSYQFRFDVPLDKFFLHNWHQDSAYYPQDPDGENSLVVNIAIQDSTRDMGVPNLILGSHKKGKMDFINNTGKDTKITQFNIIEENIDKNKIIIPEPEQGDVILYNMNLIHKSGFNSSKKTRFSALSRVFNPMAQNYKGFVEDELIIE
jgi:ectoine hydroxylase-related dioxygenase (phytanoyl-CoA dioxygenase family)